MLPYVIFFGFCSNVIVGCSFAVFGSDVWLRSCWMIGNFRFSLSYLHATLHNPCFFVLFHFNLFYFFTFTFNLLDDSVTFTFHTLHDLGDSHGSRLNSRLNSWTFSKSVDCKLIHKAVDCHFLQSTDLWNSDATNQPISPQQTMRNLSKKKLRQAGIRDPGPFTPISSIFGQQCNE